MNYHLFQKDSQSVFSEKIKSKFQVKDKLFQAKELVAYIASSFRLYTWMVRDFL